MRRQFIARAVRNAIQVEARPSLHRASFISRQDAPVLLESPSNQTLFRRNSVAPSTTRSFHTSPRVHATKKFILADIGEGIREVQIIQWHKKVGDQIEEMEELLEVQSDKATVSITSLYTGTIKTLHYQADDTAQVGSVLCEVDVEGDEAHTEAVSVTEAKQAGKPTDAQQPQKAVQAATISVPETQGESDFSGPATQARRNGSRASAHLAIPSVRHLLKQKGLNIEDVQGTGRDGRVLKEDVFRHLENSQASSSQPSQPTSRRPLSADATQQETRIALKPVQAQMFKVMTRSLSIPHFLYADEVDLTAITALRKQLNSLKSSKDFPRLSLLPFVIKACSLALEEFPLLNSRVEIADGDAPSIVTRSLHNIGVAMDTPQGLLVPNIKNVAALSIRDIASELLRLQELALAAKLSSSDLTGGTFTVSNIGSIGGTYVAPVIVSSEVAIVGMGKARDVPAFGPNGEIIKKTVGNFSWSADHRVVDGATMARMGELVRRYLEDPGTMLTALR